MRFDSLAALSTCKLSLLLLYGRRLPTVRGCIHVSTILYILMFNYGAVKQSPGCLLIALAVCAVERFNNSHFSACKTLSAVT